MVSWLPTITSIVTLAVNILFYVCIQSRLGYEYKRKEDLATICEDFFKYLSEVVSYEDFRGVPTTIREYSLKIHLCFLEGQADEDISNKLEDLFQMAKERKSMGSDNTETWNRDFRQTVRELRHLIGKYCGGIKPKKQ